VLLDRRPDTELVPQGLGDMDDAEFLNALDLDISDFDGFPFGHDLLDAVIHEDTSDAMHQAPERCLVELVGAPEAVHHLGFGSPRPSTRNAMAGTNIASPKPSTWPDALDPTGVT
jgi:hypothetical protein